MNVTFYADAHAHDGRGIDLSFDELCVELERLLDDPPVPEKVMLTAFAPYRLRDGGRRVKGTDYIDAVTVGALDVDNLPAARLPEVLAILADASAFVYATPSDGGPDADVRSIRVVVELSRDLTLGECSPVRLSLAKYLGVEDYGVRACLDPGRIFFVGRTSEAPRQCWRFNGVVAPVEVVLADAPAPVLAVKTRTTKDRPDTETDDAWLRALAGLVAPAYAKERQTWYLPFLGWTGKYLSEADQTQLTEILREVNDENHFKFLNMCERVSVTDGPGPRVIEALGDAFPAVDEFLKTHPNAPLRQWETRIARRMVGGSAATPAEAEDPPKIVARDGRYWLHDPDRGGYCPPLKEKDLEIEVSSKRVLFGADICVMKDGQPTQKLKPMREILQMYGEVAMHIALDFTQQGTSYDRRDRTLTQGFTLPDIEPVYDHDVHAWLEAMFQDGLTDALDWVASCRQDRMQNLSACLAIVGAPDLGKSLLFLVLARLWGAERPVSLSDAASQFNGPITECPIILDDECKALKAELITSSDFRERIQMTSRYFEMKGIEKRTLRGAQRMGVTANDLADIRFPDMHGREAVAAIADRFSLHVVPSSQTPAVKAALQRLRPDAGSNFVELDRFMGHFAWIWATHEPRVQRFIGRRRDETIALRAALANSLDQAPEVFMQIETFLTSAPAQSAAAQAQNAALAVRAGRLYASPTGLGGAYADIRQVHRALKPFHVRSGTVYFGTGKTRKAVRMWELDLELLRTVLTELDPAAVDARLAAE